MCSFGVAVAIDPVVNAFKPRRYKALTLLIWVLCGEHEALRLDELIAYCAGGEQALCLVEESDIEVAKMLAENRMLLSFFP